MHFRHLSYINEFYLQVNENAFTYERLGSRSGFEKKENFFNPSQLLFTVRKLAFPTFTHDGNVFIRVKSLFMSQDSNISACLFVSCGKTHQTLSLSVLMETCFFYHLQHYDEPDEFKDILMYLNIAFTVLYMIEAGLKFFALRLVSFVHSVVMASMASSCVAFEKAPPPPPSSYPRGS